MRQRNAALAAACFGVIAFAGAARGQVVINEFVYDDGGTDDREFVELYNSGPTAVDISGWVIGGQDQAGQNPAFTIPGALSSGTHSIPAGGYFVVGAATVPNVNLNFTQSTTTIASIENDADTLELRNGSTVVDAVLFEANKGSATVNTGYGTLPAAVAAQTGPGIWGNHQTNDLATAGRASSTLARYQDGRDTNNNGRDFGLRKATPGQSNTLPGTTTLYTAPNVDALANDAEVPGYAYSFSSPKAITPGTVSAFNPNVIPAPASGGKVLVNWDSTGGGNGSADERTMLGGGGFSISAYLDTNDLPVSSNANNVQFRGSEVSVFGVLGSSDSLTNLTDLSGAIGVGTAVSQNGNTGLAWVYEKVSAPVAGGAVSEKLFLVDANDGGNSNSASSTALDWAILATVDLSSTAAGWYDLGITVDALGNGVGTFNGQTFLFTTTPNLDGSFYVGYRENTQAGTVTVPTYLRPPTWTAAVPEPSSLALVGLAGLFLTRRRRA